MQYIGVQRNLSNQFSAGPTVLQPLDIGVGWGLAVTGKDAGESLSIGMGVKKARAASVDAAPAC